MRLIDKILALFLLIFLALVSAVALSVRESAVVSRMALRLEQFVGEMLRLTLYCVSGLLVLAVLAGLTLIWAWISKRHAENMRQRDGSYPLQRIKIGNATVLIDVNKTLAPAIVVSPSGIAEVYTATPEMHLQHAIARSRVSVAQALAPGDAAIASRFGSQFRIGGRSADRHLIDGKIKDLPQIPAPTPAAPTPEPVQRIKLSEAINRSSATQLIAGQADDGALAVFDPRASIHGGIVGASGTGKTSSAGYAIAAQALRNHYHLVIIDPKGGADWSPWATHAEWHESAPDVFPQQVEALFAEHERRMKLVTAAGVRTIDDVPGAPPHTLVILEEYGDLISQLRRGDKRTADATDNLLDRLMRLSRASGIHLLLIDQYPEEWSQQVIGNTKWLAVFRLGPNQGAKVRQYNADRLPDHGRFIVREREYNAWFAAPYLNKFLPQLPPSRAPRVIDGQYTVSRSTVPGNDRGVGFDRSTGEERQNGTDEPSRWDDVVAAWFAANPQALTGTAQGISDLARAMCQNNEGSTANYEAYKGRAHKLFHEFRNAVRLPGGERIGTDTSYTEVTQ